MKYPVFAIRDNKVGFSPQLMVQENDQAAARGFSFLVSNDKTVMGFSPFDYSLFKIGEFDIESGQFDPIIPYFICNGGSMYEKSESESIGSE